MFTKHNALALLLLLLVNFVAASPLPAPPKASKPAPKSAPKSAPKAPAHCPAWLHKRSNNILIGYKGIKESAALQPRVSGGGELGDVFYVADSVDLAYSFARGPNPALDQVCGVFVDAGAWAAQPKVWVPASVIKKGSAAMNSAYPGAVLFAPHTNAGLRAGAPHDVYQLGIRQAQFARLALQVQCSPKACFEQSHHTLGYHGLTHEWHIQ